VPVFSTNVRISLKIGDSFSSCLISNFPDLLSEIFLAKKFNGVNGVAFFPKTTSGFNSTTSCNPKGNSLFPLPSNKNLSILSNLDKSLFGVCKILCSLSLDLSRIPFSLILTLERNFCPLSFNFSKEDFAILYHFLLEKV